MISSLTWFEQLAALREEQQPCVLIVVSAAKGSAPREVGARLIVAEDRIVWGTIGGGKLEHLALEQARELSATGRALSQSRDYPLAEAAGQCCGGSVTLFFEAFNWTPKRVVIFGAGHVAQALAGLSGYLGAELELIDPRQESELQPVPPAQRPWTLTLVDAPEGEVERLAKDSLVLVMTHDHSLDQTILEELLRRDAFAYIGLIGSERKWARFRKRLAARGFSAEAILRVRSPIGISKGSKQPTAIAISVAAELLEVMAASSQV